MTETKTAIGTKMASIAPISANIDITYGFRNLSTIITGKPNKPSGPSKSVLSVHDLM